MTETEQLIFKDRVQALCIAQLQSATVRGEVRDGDVAFPTEGDG